MSVRPLDPESLLAHAGFVRALAREVVFDAELAREVEQETWLAALEHAPRELRSPRAWLATLVRHVARRAWRRSAARRAREELVARERVGTADDAVFPSPAEILEREQTRRELVAAVLRLDEPLRGTIVLRYLEGLELSEIGRRTSVPLETVRSRVKRGLELLRADLERQDPRRDARAWSVGLVRAFQLELPASRAWTLLARALLPLVTVMSSTTKLAAAALALALVLFSAWTWFERDARLPAAPAAVAQAEIALAEPGEKEPVASSADSNSARAPAEIPPSATVTAAAPQTGALRVELRWADDDSPAADVLVRVDLMRSPEGTVATRRARSSADGVAEFADLPSGTATAHALFGGSRGEGVMPGQTTTMRLAIPVGIAVAGTVRDADGTPVADARIFLSGGVMDPQYEGDVVARSDARGRFGLRSAPAQVGASLSARAPGRAPTAQVVLSGAPRSRVELELVFEHEGSELRGRVLARDGTPVVGARVLVGSEREIVPQRRTDGTFSYGPVGELVESGADGSFALEAVPLGPTRVQVRAAGFAPWSGICDAEASSFLEVRLERGAVVRGTVRDAHGAVVGGALISAGGEYGFAYLAAHSDAHGEYELLDLAAGARNLEVTAERTKTLPVGKHDLFVTNEHLGSAKRTLVLAAGESVRWDPELANGLALHGRVEATGGEPLEGWRVYAVGRAFSSDVFTDAKGCFAIVDCPAELSLSLYARGGTAFPVASWVDARPGPEEVVLRPDPELVGDVRISGRLVDAHGAAVRNADVYARHATLGGGALLHPDVEDGRFAFERLPAGEWTLEVDAHEPGWGVERRTRALAHGETWDAGAITLGAGGTLLMLPRPAPLVTARAAQIVVSDAEGRASDWIAWNAEGARSRPLAPGRYRVTLVGLEGAALLARVVVVVAGEETRVELPLVRGRQVSLALASRDPLAAHVFDGTGELGSCNARVYESGIARAEFELAPGRYRAEFRAADGSLTCASEFEVEAGEGELSLDIGAAALISKDSMFLPRRRPRALLVLFLNSDGTVAGQQKIGEIVGGFIGSLPDYAHFGFALASPGDLDGDGLQELAVRAGIPNSTWILFLNANGTVRAYHEIPWSDPVYGGTTVGSDFQTHFDVPGLAAMGDLDGDGIGDIAVGAPGDDDGDFDAGAVWILYLNSDGTAKAAKKIAQGSSGFTGDLQLGGELGYSMARLGDVNGDGFVDLSVAERGSDRRWVLFLDGHQDVIGTALLPFTGEAFGRIGDLDADGIAECASDSGRGFLVWFLAADGHLRKELLIAPGRNGMPLDPDIEYLGEFSFAPLGDLDGDGVPELAVGDYGDTQTGGAVWILSLARTLVRNGSGSNPLILSASAEPVLGQTWSATLDCTSHASGIAVLVGHERALDGTFISAGELLVDPSSPRFFLFMAPHAGAPVGFSAAVPNDLALLDLQLYVQGLCTGAPGPVLSNALGLLVGG